MNRVRESDSWASKADNLARSRWVSTGGAALVVALAGAGMASSLARRPVSRAWLMFLLAWISARFVSSWLSRVETSATRSGSLMPPLTSANS